MEQRFLGLVRTVPAAFAVVLTQVILAVTAYPAVAQPAYPPNPPAAATRAQSPQLIYSPWTKFCLSGKEANAEYVCFTGKDGRTYEGTPVVAAVLIEPEGDSKKVLRVTLPIGMSIQPGTRVIVDQGEPMAAPYVICFNNGCMADYEATGELIGQLKKGQALWVQGINDAGEPISRVVPLAGFATAHDGLPSDPKAFEEQQQKLRRQSPWKDDTLDPRYRPKVN